MGNYDNNLVERLLTELSRKEISTLESMSWGELSTHFSKKGFEAAKSSGLALEEAGSLIHDYWVNAVKAVVTSESRSGQEVPIVCLTYGCISGIPFTHDL